MSEVQIGATCVLCGRPQVEHANGECPTAQQIGMSIFRRETLKRQILSDPDDEPSAGNMELTKVTTKVRITNIVDDQSHSNGDVVIHGLASGRVILAPGETHEEWLRHGDLPEPLTITERWPSQPK